MWDEILTKSLQGRAFMEFRADIFNSTVYYEDKGTCEDLVNATGFSNKNDINTGKSNACYSSYSEATKSTIKSIVASLQYCVGGNQNPEVPGRYQRTVFPRYPLFSCLTALMVAVWKSYRLYNHRT